MTVLALTRSIVALVKNLTNLLNQHSTTIIHALILMVVGLLAFGFTSIASFPDYAAWMYFITAMLAFAVIAFILFRSSRQR